jgi:hypothetical protein
VVSSKKRTWIPSPSLQPSSICQRSDDVPLPELPPFEVPPFVVPPVLSPVESGALGLQAATVIAQSATTAIRRSVVVMTVTSCERVRLP